MPEEIFDPDKLYLTKADILGIGDRLIARWKKNEKANIKMIAIAKIAKFLVNRYRPEEIEAYYRDFWKEAFSIMQSNALAGDPALKTLQRVHNARPEPPEVISELDFSLSKTLAYGAMKDDA